MNISFSKSLCALLKLFFLVLVVPNTGKSQIRYPDSLKIPVTFYDFHADSSNPEFEITPSGTPVKLRMVADTLDSQRKPVLGPSPYFNVRVDRWFRPWVPGDSIIYNYYEQYPARYGRYSALGEGYVKLDHDTAFINHVFNDTLVFHLLAGSNGSYQFSNQNFFPLDGRGFGHEGRRDSAGALHNFSYAMELHTEFTKVPGLVFEFEGDDDVWAFVDGKLRMDLGGIHASQVGSFDLDQASDLVDNGSYTFDFFYVERHVNHSKIKITTNIISPPVNFDLGIFPDSNICPFTPVTLSAHVTDDFSGERPDISQNTRWRVIRFDGQPDSVLKGSLGNQVVFTPEVAYSRVLIEGSVWSGKDTLRDTVTLNIGPCEAYKIYIEAKPVVVAGMPVDTAALRKPQELPDITIPEDSTTKVAYAIARDISGAYVRLADSQQTEWKITPDGVTVARAESVENQRYRGVITRIDSEGNTYATAQEPDLLMDSVPVIIASYYIVELQLRDTLGNPVTDITLETDSSCRYEVYGLKSTAVNDRGNPDSWVPTSVKWDTLGALFFENSLPGNAQTSTLEPRSPGQGYLVFTNTDSRTDSLLIPITLVRSPASRIEITLVPQNQRRAGDTLAAVVRIFNTDGLVPGLYCFGLHDDDPDNGEDTNKVAYGDTLGTGGRRHPTVTVDGVHDSLNVFNQTIYRLDQCFQDGIDTIRFVLFYAPFTPDSLHQITVQINPGLRASTERFRLVAGDLFSLRIEDKDYVPLPPQTLSGEESVSPFSVGYDEYGNRIGRTSSFWTTDGTLDPINEDGIQTHITASGAVHNKEGQVWAEATRKDGSKAKASLPVTIIGPRKTVAEAWTRDLDGNGYLDAIEIRFNRAVEPSEISPEMFSDIRSKDKLPVATFTVGEIARVLEKDSMTYILHFTAEDLSSTVRLKGIIEPQTDMILTFSLTGAATIADGVTTTKDGAGPVIWYVERDVKTNTVKVVLSEEVKNVNGNDLKTSDRPADAFHVYYSSDSLSGFTEVHVLDSGIMGFSAPRIESRKTVLEFKLPKDKSLTLANWMNLTFQPPLLQDRFTNQPHPNNVKRQVTLTGVTVDLRVAPNPSRADYSFVPRGVFNFNSSTRHVELAKEGKGLLIRISIGNPNEEMSASMKIYDMVGNLVQWIYVADFREYLKTLHNYDDMKNAATFILDCFWNYSNRNGMTVAPGIYRLIFHLNYKNPALPDETLVVNVGKQKDRQ